MKAKNKIVILYIIIFILSMWLLINKCKDELIRNDYYSFTIFSNQHHGLLRIKEIDGGATTNIYHDIEAIDNYNDTVVRKTLEGECIYGIFKKK